MTFIEFEPIVNFEELNNNISRILNNNSVQDVKHANSLIPKIDISEDEKNIYMEAELPGVKKEDLKIKLEDNKLTISGEKKHAAENEENKRFFSRERIFGTFEKVFTIQTEINKDNIKAEFENGVLSLTIGKFVPKKKERTIEIK
ncbi:MAG: Hsp20/alpha crystallin family protein [Ignavibacteriaceae bacterium]|jgi:HSP20 family protein